MIPADEWRGPAVASNQKRVEAIHWPPADCRAAEAPYKRACTWVLELSYVPSTEDENRDTGASGGWPCQVLLRAVRRHGQAQYPYAVTVECACVMFPPQMSYLKSSCGADRLNMAGRGSYPRILSPKLAVSTRGEFGPGME